MNKSKPTIKPEVIKIFAVLKDCAAKRKRIECVKEIAARATSNRQCINFKVL
jgi:hypothetical protein